MIGHYFSIPLVVGVERPGFLARAGYPPRYSAARSVGQTSTIAVLSFDDVLGVPLAPPSIPKRNADWQSRLVHVGMSVLLPNGSWP